MCVCACVQMLDVVFIDCSSAYFLRQGISLKPTWLSVSFRDPYVFATSVGLQACTASAGITGMYQFTVSYMNPRGLN